MLTIDDVSFACYVYPKKKLKENMFESIKESKTAAIIFLLVILLVLKNTKGIRKVL